MKRRYFLRGLSLAAATGLGYSVWRYWPQPGFGNPCASGLPETVRQHPLYQKIWSGIDAGKVWDCHVHLIGNGDSGRRDAPWLSPRFEGGINSLSHPLLQLQKRFFMNGACIDRQQADESAIERLIELSKEMAPGFKAMLFAFDWWHDDHGRAIAAQSAFHVPNRYAARIAQLAPAYFEWVASIHPYRPDAVDALHEAKAQGARAVKWLPQVMNIDPMAPACDRFYSACAELDMPIISHAGREFALPGHAHHLANPLRLRRALDAGVRVVVAHCATTGSDIDLDVGPQGVRRSSFELFARMMDNPHYRSHLYGDISSLPLLNHQWALPALLENAHWHGRLLNGSDYPLPGIMPLVDVGWLQRKGLLDEAAVPFLLQIKPYNPLLFDFALKRLLHSGHHYFAADIFHTRPFFVKATDVRQPSH